MYICTAKGGLNSKCQMKYNIDVNIRKEDFRRQILTVKELLNKNFCYQAFESGFYMSPLHSRIIEALLNGLPPEQLLVEDNLGEWNILNGTQLVKSLLEFCKYSGVLCSTYFNTGKDRLSFADLSPLEKNSLLSTEITAIVISPGVSPQARFGIYMSQRQKYDLQSLHTIRKGLYPSYKYIEWLAKRINSESKQNNRFKVEKEICTLLVGIHYKDFIGNTTKHNLDIVENAILENLEITDTMSENIVAAYEKTAMIFKELKSIDENLTRALAYHCIINDKYNWQSILSAIKDNSEEYFYAEEFCKQLNHLIEKLC